MTEQAGLASLDVLAHLCHPRACPEDPRRHITPRSEECTFLGLDLLGARSNEQLEGRLAHTSSAAAPNLTFFTRCCPAGALGVGVRGRPFRGLALA
jgi:hypothetical protein